MCVLCSREVSACIENDGPAIYDSIPIVFNTFLGAFCRRTVPQIFWLEMLETVPWQPLDIYWDAWPTQGSQGVCGYRHWSFVFHSAVYFIGHSGGPREQAPWPQLPLLNCQSHYKSLVLSFHAWVQYMCILMRANNPKTAEQSSTFFLQHHLFSMPLWARQQLCVLFFLMVVSDRQWILAIGQFILCYHIAVSVYTFLLYTVEQVCMYIHIIYVQCQFSYLFLWLVCMHENQVHQIVQT